MNKIIFFLSMYMCMFSNVSFAQTAEAPPEQEWKPKISWSGDFRYRGGNSKESTDEARTFQQVRVRLGVKADVNESTQAVIRLATATSAISANQTLGDSSDPGMARRPFGVDHAYADFKFLDGHAHYWAGRVANPYWAPAKVQTLFDTDLAFEGMALKFDWPGESSGIFVNLGGFMISENYTAPNDNVDTGLVGGEVGYSLKGEDWSWISHLGHFRYLNVKNHVITRVEKSAKIDSGTSNPNERFRGNTVYLNGGKYFYKFDYVLFELGSEWKKKFGNIESTLYFDAIKNDARQKDNLAVEAGVNVKWKSLTVGYARIDKEADSMISSFTDSDSNGGGTNNQGDRIMVNYGFNKNSAVQVTHYIAKRNLDVTHRNFTMTHADLVVGF